MPRPLPDDAPAGLAPSIHILPRCYVVNPFSLPGTFLKGNLHTHTTNSDGRYTPQEIVELYRENGYDFLAITDHHRLTPIDSLRTNGMVLLPGMELHPAKGNLGQSHHIVAIGLETEIAIPQTDSLQEALAYITSRSALTFIAHPYWTSLTLCDLLDLPGYLGIEVFNYTCQCGIGRGDSGVHWDELLARGQRPLGLAVDDTHMHYWDALGGWIMLKAPSRDPEAIISAIAAGHFYSSSGPTIEDVTLHGDHITVRCSPCQAVHVISPAPGCGYTTHVLQRDGGPYTEVTLPISPAWVPIRIECVDERGHKAWTNPFWPD